MSSSNTVFITDEIEMEVDKNDQKNVKQSIKELMKRIEQIKHNMIELKYKLITQQQLINEII